MAAVLLVEKRTKQLKQLKYKKDLASVRSFLKIIYPISGSVGSQS